MDLEPESCRNPENVPRRDKRSRTVLLLRFWVVRV